MQTIKVTKRDGRLELLDLNKIHRVIEWAAEGLNVSVSQVELKAKIQFYNGILTEDIHETLVRSAAELIDVDTPDYQHMAARLAVFHLRKKAYGEFTPPSLYNHICNMVEAKHYDKEILDKYTKEEIDYLDTKINHELDLSLAYAGLKQLEGKYLVQDRTTGKIFETPNMAYMLIAMVIFGSYNEEYGNDARLDYVVRFYNALSKGFISLPSPIMAGVRTVTRQFASCLLVSSDDSLKSINATTSVIVEYIAKRAGIGVNGGKIRALGSKIRNGEVKHTGVIPFWKMFQAAVKSSSQGGIRGGAATLFYPLWHLEAESLLVLKNNRGVEENRIRQLDYGVQINKLLYSRLIKDEDITLFSPDAVPGLYDAFFADQKEFERLYTEAENNPAITKKKVRAVELFSSLLQERASTGRIYIQNVDHCNTHSSFRPEVAPIYQSNLCLEITLPTKPLTNVEDENGEVPLCTLAAINLGKIESEADIEEATNLLVRGLDELISYQDYLIPASRKSTMMYRPLGIGVINYAYYLAKNGVKISDGSALPITHSIFEALQYYCLKASVEVAKVKGPCLAFENTTYSQGTLPIDTYKKDIDSFANFDLKLDWESLRKDIVEHGLRNATLTAIAPTETSSQVSNATNGVEPPRSYVTVKVSKDGILRQVVPEIEKYKDQYETLWQLPDNEGTLKAAAVMQKFIDQSISTNTAYDPSKFPDNKVPMQLLIKDLLVAYKYGIKTLYYHNTNDGADDKQFAVEDDGCAGGACKI